MKKYNANKNTNKNTHKNEKIVGKAVNTAVNTPATSPANAATNKNEKLAKIIAIAGLAVLIANLLFFAFKIYSDLIFWIVLVVVALIAFPGMSWLRKKNNN